MALAKVLNSSAESRGPVILFGKPGSGKAQLALAFCSAHTTRFDGIHWIEANQASDIAVQIAAYGQLMQITPWPEKITDQVTATINKWQLSPNRLIVFNHLADPVAFSGWMKNLPRLPVLITTSSLEGYPDYPVVRVGHLHREESIALLRKLAPRFEKSPDRELDPLASRLADFAFALNIAGRYLNEDSKTSISQYLAEIEKTASILNSSVGEMIASSELSLSPAQAAVIIISIKLLDGKGERERLGRRIVNIVSLCAPYVAIPVELLRQSLEVSVEKMAPVERSLAWLYSLGLLQQSGLGPLMHSIISKFGAPDNVSRKTLVPLLADALIALKGESAQKSGQHLFLQPHIRAIAASAEELGLKQAGILWNLLGSDLRNAGELAEAKACLERCLAFEERLYGPEHVRVVATMKELGKVFSDLGDLYTAKRYYERAIGVNEKLFSPSYPDVANILNDLGHVLFDLRDLVEAKVCFERAISIYETAYGFGPKHPALATAAGNLGRVLRDMDDLQGAKNNFERALAVDEWVYGPRNPKIATRANYLGRIYYSLGDLIGARNCFERVTSILEESGSVEDAGLATAYNNLGLVLQDLGNASRAQESFARALEIDQKIFGLEHPNIARDENNLGGAYAALDNLPAARDCFIRAMEIDEKIFGLFHPNNAANANNLGRVLYNMGDLTGAMNAFERTLAIDEKINGPMHAKVGTDINNLGIVFFEVGDLDQAKSCFERALEIFSREYPKDHPKLLKAKKYLDRVQQRINER